MSNCTEMFVEDKPATCKAVTSTGKKCSRLSGASGFCVVHEKKVKRDNQKGRYTQVIDAVLAACRIKGWSTTIEAKDEQYHLATIKIWKRFDIQEVSGLIH